MVQKIKEKIQSNEHKSSEKKQGHTSVESYTHHTEHSFS